MGTLKDAIQEHLELKRLHGATDEELQRIEREALAAGAVAEPVAEVVAPPQEQVEPELAPQPPVEPELSAEFKSGDPLAADDSEQIEPEPTQAHSVESWIEPEELELQPGPGADQQPDSDADLLDKTPDFLQETPEHDRLWFEQQKPRDFDFGK